MKTHEYVLVAAVLLLSGSAAPRAQEKYVDPSGQIRVALSKQPLSPTGPSKGPATMADGGIQAILKGLGAVVRVEEARLTPDESLEYGPKASAIGFATIPSADEGGLSIAAVNRMIAGAVRGAKARQR